MPIYFINYTCFDKSHPYVTLLTFFMIILCYCPWIMFKEFNNKNTHTYITIFMYYYFFLLCFLSAFFVVLFYIMNNHELLFCGLRISPQYKTLLYCQYCVSCFRLCNYSFRITWNYYLFHSFLWYSISYLKPLCQFFTHLIFLFVF